MALALGTYEPAAGVIGEVRTQMEAQFGAPAPAAAGDAEKLCAALGTALFNVLTGASSDLTARASTSTPNAQSGGSTLTGTIL